MSLQLVVGIVGATGIVGQTAVDVLLQDFEHFSVKELKLFASRASVGKRMNFGQRDIAITEMTLDNLAKCDVLFFASDAAIAREYIPKLAQQGVLCIDKSSAYRDDPLVPLVVPEVNHTAVTKSRMNEFPVVANPNCCATPLVVALQPLAKKFGLKRVIVSTYQSVSGAGKAAIDVLRTETEDFFRQEDLSVKASTVFPKSIAFNVMPFVAEILESGDTDEEAKIIFETRKILNLPNLKIAATSARVPTFVGHAEAVSVELEKNADLQSVIRCLQEQSGLNVIDFSTPVSDENPYGQFVTPRECHGENDVFLSRLRPTDAFDGCGFSFWLTCDNLRKGAALNAIQILDLCASQGFVRARS